MAYSKTPWVDFVEGGTLIDAARLNHAEDGIEAAHQAVDGLPFRDDNVDTSGAAVGGVSAFAQPAAGAFSLTTLPLLVLAGVGDGVTDDTAAINAQLAAVPAGTVVRGVPGRTYKISAPLVIRSDTTLDMTGATVTLAAGSNCQMIHNWAYGQTARTVYDAVATAASTTLTSATAEFGAGDVGKTVTVYGAGPGGNPHITTIASVTDAATAVLAAAAKTTITAGSLTIGPRDQNITLRGGTWARAANAGTLMNLHSIVLLRVTGLRIEGLTYTSTQGKYGILVYACHQFSVQECVFACKSDGVHMTGACTSGFVSGLYGVTGDDVAAVTASEYADYVIGDLGSAQGIVIQRVYATPSIGNMVKLLPGRIGGTIPVTVRGCTVRDIRGGSDNLGIWLGGDSAQAATQGGTVENVTVENVSNLGGGHGVSFTYATFRGIVLRSIVTPPTAFKFAVNFATGCVVEDVTVEDCSWTPPASTPAIGFSSSSPYPSVKILRVSRCRINTATQSSSLIAASNANLTLTAVMISDLQADRTAWPCGDFGVAVALWLHAVRCEAPVNGWFHVGATGSVTVHAASGLLGPTSVGIDAGGAVASRDLGMRLDVGATGVAKTAGDLAYNTNAARSCGVGPVICDGTNWKHLYTGATY